MGYLALQWGSEIQTSLDSEWSKRGWVANGPDLQHDLKTGKPNHLKSRKIAAIVS